MMYPIVMENMICAIQYSDVIMGATGLCEGNSPVTDEFPVHKGPVAPKKFPFDDVTMNGWTLLQSFVSWVDLFQRRDVWRFIMMESGAQCAMIGMWWYRCIWIFLIYLTTGFIHMYKFEDNDKKYEYIWIDNIVGLGTLRVIFVWPSHSKGITE